MKFFDIRDRVLIAALLPVALVSVLLSAVFLMGRVSDIDEAHNQRARSLARQVASASEYGMFSANMENLQALASGVMNELDVRSVAIVDVQSQVLTSAGRVGYAGLPALGRAEIQWNDEYTRHDILVQPVIAHHIALDDLFEPQAEQAEQAEQAAQALPVLGYVVIEMSRGTLLARERDMLLAGLSVALGGLLLGGLLAVRIGRGVIRPILRVTDMIERIGRGDFTARAEIRVNDPLRKLQMGLNQMAERLEQGRDELEQRVAQATIELRSKKEEAELATLVKSRFLAAASHDLRQPTHALGMFVARLAQLPHDEETRHLVTHLDAAVRALQDLLNSLLDISRLDAQAVKVYARPICVAELLEQIRSGFMPRAADQGLSLKVRSQDVWVMSDPILLHSILLNLVSNALRYTRRGGVLVACRRMRDGSRLRIEVWDSGIGIAPQHHQDIFKEFFQISNTERDRDKGLGLGLNIVERTARLLGHSLYLCSKPGHGSRFGIEVPIVSAPNVPASPTTPALLTIDDLSGLSVLVVEDDRLVSRALHVLLDSWGCQVIVAEGLDGAVLALEKGFAPEVIISDYRLRAGSNGIDTINRLRTVAGALVPACLMSGDTDPGLMQAARLNGLSLLHKPVRPAKLRSLIRRLANRETMDAGLEQLHGDDLV